MVRIVYEDDPGGHGHDWEEVRISKKSATAIATLKQTITTQITVHDNKKTESDQIAHFQCLLNACQETNDQISDSWI